MNANQDTTTRSRVVYESDIVDPDCLLVRRAKDGDLRAFEQLMLAHNHRIFRTIYRITGNREDTEDRVQETFLRAYRGLHQFQANSKFSTWLTRIAVNQALMCLRKRRSSDISLDQPIAQDNKPVSIDIQEWRPNPEQEYARSEVSAKLYQELSTLPQNVRSVFVLHHVHEYTTEETALKLGITVAAAKSRVVRARRRLRIGLGGRPDILRPDPCHRKLELDIEV